MSDLAVEDKRGDRWGAIYYADIIAPQAKKLPDNAFRIWVMLHTYAPMERHKGWSVSVERLGEDCGFSRSTVFRALKALRDSNLVQYFKRGACNHYILIRPRNPNSDTAPKTRGVRSDTSTGSTGDTSTGSTGDTHTRSYTSITSNTDEKEQNGNSDTPKVNKNGETLTGFLGETIEELYQELSTMSKRDQGKALFGGNWLIELRGPLDTFDKWWDLDHHFKERLTHFSEYAWGLGYNFIMDRAVESFAPVLGSASARAAFLTECQKIIQAQGR